MSFLTGSATFQRFKVRGHQLGPFGETHLESLADNAAGRQRIASADGVETGWTAGESILDVAFTLEKNIIADALCFEFRVDTNKPPADLLKAYYQAEIKALSKDNPSGFASAKQKREAKETARNRIEDEAKDGRFLKRKCIPILWDATRGEVLFGATSLSQAERFTSLFRTTFGLELEMLTAGALAYECAGVREYEKAVDNSTLSTFIPGTTPEDAAWIAGESSRDYLGNEFLLWLWFLSDGETDAVKLPDGSEWTFMIARSLVLDCPRGDTGIDGFRHEGPSRLPEAKRAIRSGKLPRKCGLTVVRQDQQFEFTLHAEAFGVGSAKLPKPEEDNPRARLEGRIKLVRDLIEGINLAYSAFLTLRFGPGWGAELKRMQNWIGVRERETAAA